MKRLAALILAAVLLLMGCAQKPAHSTNPTTTAKPDTTTEFDKRWAYACLSQEQQANYRAVFEAVQQGFDKATHVSVTAGDVVQHSRGISVPLPNVLSTEQQVSELYEAFVQDNPAFFHIGSVYGYDGRQYGKDRCFTALKLTYTMSVEERVFARKALENRCKTLLETLSPTMTAFQKELALHDALIAQCTYDEAAAADKQPLTTYPSSFTAYGALVEGKAVCEGYAHAMQYLLEAAGVTATVVTGHDAQGQPHMWNAVVLEGDVYHLDATWNDAEDLPTYAYFNLNDEELKRTHTVDGHNFGLKDAAATEQNYYRMTDSYLDTLRIEDIAGHIAARFADGEETVHLRFSDSTFSNALFFVRSTHWFADTVSAYLPDGMSFSDKYRFAFNETYKTIAICKKIS